MSKLCPTYIAHTIGGPVRGENWTTEVGHTDENSKYIQLNQYKIIRDVQKTSYLYVFTIFEKGTIWYLSKTDMSIRYKSASQMTILKQAFFGLTVKLIECKTSGNEIWKEGLWNGLSV